MATSTRPSTNQLYRAVRETSANRELFLTCLGLEPHVINEHKRANPSNEDWAFVQCLEYYMNNCCEDGKEWQGVYDALIECKDTRTANKIKQSYISHDQSKTETIETPSNLQTDDGEDTDSYTMLYSGSTDQYCTVSHPSFTNKDERDEYLTKLKTTTITEYNAAATKIEEHHQEIERALNKESLKAKKTLTDYKEKLDRYGNEYEKDVTELIERTTKQQKNLKEAISSIEQGHSISLAAIKKAEEEMSELEKLNYRLEKHYAKYQKWLPQSSNSLSSSTNVLQDLQAIVTVHINVTGTVDEDDYAISWVHQ